MSTVKRSPPFNRYLATYDLREQVAKRLFLAHTARANDENVLFAILVFVHYIGTSKYDLSRNCVY